MKKQFLAACLVGFATCMSAVSAPQARQAEPKAVEYNVTGCSPNGLLAEHVVLSADGKTLDFNYYRDGDAAVKSGPSDPDHFVAQGQISDPRKDGSRKYDGIGYLPDGKGGKSTVEIHAVLYKGKFGALVLVDTKLRFVLYGYEGKVDDLVKLDQDEAKLVCLAMVSTDSDGVPDILNQWLHDGEKNDSNVQKAVN